MVPMGHGGPRRPRGDWLWRPLLVILLAAWAFLFVSPSATLAASAPGRSGTDIVSPTAAVGSGPDGLALDALTHSLYTVDQGGSVSVLDTGRCNAEAAQGCSTERVGTVALPPGSDPREIAIDTTTDTVYVVDTSADEISVINGAGCNATNRWGCTQTSVLLADPSRRAIVGLDGDPCPDPVASGCGQTVKTVHVGAFPDGIAVDPVTDTVYVTNRGDTAGHPGHTVSVIDGATCNGVASSGCGRVATLEVGQGPGWIALDDATRTAYTANQAAGTVSVINMAICDAADTSGCGQRTPTIAVGQSPFVLTIDQELHTAYVASSLHDTVSVVDLDAAACAAARRDCRWVSHTARVSALASGVAVDTANRSVYMASQGPGTVSVIDAATCNSSDMGGCARPAATVHVGADPAGVAIDQATGTVYVADNGGATVSMIDAAECNAADQAGCRRTPVAITVGRNPFGIGIDHGR